MKKYFFLGFGSGLILAGILIWIFKPIETTNTNSKKSQLAKYYVQLGAYENYENCLILKQKIEEFNIEIKKSEDGIYKMISEDFNSYNEALKVSTTLNNKYSLDSYVKKRGRK